MTTLDYTQLFEPSVHLSLHRSQGGWYAVTDQHGRLFTPPVDLGFALKFMAAMREKKDATIDEESVERFAHSVRVPSSGRPVAGTDGMSAAGLPDSVRGGDVGAGFSPDRPPASRPDPFSNVVPLRPYNVSDQEALAIANQHDIQRTLKH